MLLRKHAAKKLKEEQELIAVERRKVIDQRVGQPRKTEGLNQGRLSICHG